MTGQASFSARIFAFVIDAAVVAQLSGAVFLTALGAAVNGNPWQAAALSGILTLLLTPFFALSYTVGMHAWHGQTVGKMAMGIRVVTLSGETMPAGLAFLRATGTLLSMFSFGIGFLWAIFIRDSATWHDRIARTTVIVAE